MVACLFVLFIMLVTKGCENLPSQLQVENNVRSDRYVVIVRSGLTNKCDTLLHSLLRVRVCNLRAAAIPGVYQC